MAIKELLGTALRMAGRTAEQAPFASEVLSALTEAERVLVRAVRAHLVELELSPPDNLCDNHYQPLPTPSIVLRSLLDRSMYSRPDESRTALYLGLLNDLLPDEARILAALSDGSAYPVIDVAEPLLGTSTAFVLTNASTVGRAAGVSLPQHTPLYVGRLVLAGLATIGPEGSNSTHDDYEMLLTDAAVNAALAKARRGVLSARVMRRTVRITELGHELWEAAT